MTQPPTGTRRLAAASGLLLAGAVALWWLGSTRQVLLAGADASRPAAQALLTLLLLRGMLLALTAPIDGLRGPLVAASLAAALRLAPAWPVAVLAWSASRVPGAALLLAEGVLLLSALVLPAVGAGLARLLRRPALAESASLMLGVLLAAALWQGRSALAGALGAAV